METPIVNPAAVLANPTAAPHFNLQVLLQLLQAAAALTLALAQAEAAAKGTPPPLTSPAPNA